MTGGRGDPWSDVTYSEGVGKTSTGTTSTATATTNTATTATTTTTAYGQTSYVPTGYTRAQTLQSSPVLIVHDYEGNRVTCTNIATATAPAATTTASTAATSNVAGGGGGGGGGSGWRVRSMGIGSPGGSMIIGIYRDASSSR